MAKFKPQHSRLLFIDEKIGNRKHPNCSSLAEEWEVSRKTIQRDIDYMRYQLDAPIQYCARHRGYFYTEANFKLPAISIKESDLFAIYLAEKLLVQYEGTPLYGSLKSVYQKIEQSLPDKVSVDSITESGRFTVLSTAKTVIREGVWETVFGCLRDLKRIEINYQTPGKKSASRKIDIYHAIKFDGDWYIIGLCHLRNDIRTFSLARILSTAREKESYTIPQQFDFNQFSGSHFGVHWGEANIHVKIRFSVQVVPYVLEREWHPSQKIEKCKDGSIVLALTVNHLLELKRWILSWGKNAVVLEPELFRTEIEMEIEEMSQCYG